MLALMMDLSIYRHSMYLLPSKNSLRIRNVLGTSVKRDYGYALQLYVNRSRNTIGFAVNRRIENKCVFNPVSNRSHKLLREVRPWISYQKVIDQTAVSLPPLEASDYAESQQGNSLV